MIRAVVPEASIRALRFGGSWRHYQSLALDAFDRDVANGSTSTHVVAPPGSGKTLLGVEIARRLGTPALVLCPNTAVQAQWLGALGQFGAPSDVASTSPSSPIACLTYQSLCQLDDPAGRLDEVALHRWAAERAAATASTVEEVIGESQTWEGPAADRRDREIARVVASIKREIARADHSELNVAHLLSDGARERVATLRANGVRTLVLDECHHLASLWGYVVQAVVRELPEAHIVGLTATPPGELSADDAALYANLLGPVDFTVPTPAVVRDGFLAPYQELAWLTVPLPSETAWLAERDIRFAELVTALHGIRTAPGVSLSGSRTACGSAVATTPTAPSCRGRASYGRNLTWRPRGRDFSPRPAASSRRASLTARPTVSGRTWTTGWCSCRTTP